MKMLTFANRNIKELMRDPLNLAFMFGFPLVLLLLLSAIQANIPVKLFEIQHLTPGIHTRGYIEDHCRQYILALVSFRYTEE